MKCVFVSTGKERDGKREHQCVQCRFVRWSHYPPERIHRECGETVAAPPEAYEAILPPADRLLLGDRIQQLTAAIGIPHCNGCESRKEWLNNAHLWLRGLWRS